MRATRASTGIFSSRLTRFTRLKYRVKFDVPIKKDINM